MMLETALQQVKDEVEKAQANFPKMRSLHEGYAILLEEVDGLWEAIKADRGAFNSLRIRGEAQQVAAEAIRFLMDLT